MFNNIPRNVWGLSPKYNIPHSPRFPHSVPHSCIPGFIHSRNQNYYFEKSQLIVRFKKVLEAQVPSSSIKSDSCLKLLGNTLITMWTLISTLTLILMWTLVINTTNRSSIFKITLHVLKTIFHRKSIQHPHISYEVKIN